MVEQGATGRPEDVSTIGRFVNIDVYVSQRLLAWADKRSEKRPRKGIGEKKNVQAIQFRLSESELSSPHSVDPTNPYSSLSHDASILLRLCESPFLGAKSVECLSHCPVWLPTLGGKYPQATSDFVHSRTATDWINSTRAPRIVVVSQDYTLICFSFDRADHVVYRSVFISSFRLTVSLLCFHLHKDRAVLPSLSNDTLTRLGPVQ